jgi:hypothetical protein
LSEAQGRVTEGKALEGDNDIVAASIEGDRKTLRADAYIPLTMAVIYLGIMLYFKSIGGYRRVAIEETS